MRLYITLTQSDSTIPFNYQQLLTGVIHKWLGENNTYHGVQNPFCFSWLQNISTSKKGITIEDGAYFFISSYDTDFIRTILKGAMKDPKLFNGSKVKDIQLVEHKDFTNKERFILASPILLKRKLNNGQYKYAEYNDSDFNELLTRNLKNKLDRSGLSSENVSAYIDSSYTKSHTKLIEHKKIYNRVNICPIIIEGTPEQIFFAWSVGLGQSTGIGFGALK